MNRCCESCNHSPARELCNKCVSRRSQMGLIGANRGIHIYVSAPFPFSMVEDFLKGSLGGWHVCTSSCTLASARWPARPLARCLGRQSACFRSSARKSARIISWRARLSTHVSALNLQSILVSDGKWREATGSIDAYIYGLFASSLHHSWIQLGTLLMRFDFVIG